MNPFYLFIAIFMLVKKSVDLVFDGIAALFTMSNERPRDSSRGGILDASQVETYSDDEDKVKEKGDNQS